MVFNLVLTGIRAYVVDIASKRVDVELSSRIMEQVLDLRMESRPVSWAPRLQPALLRVRARLHRLGQPDHAGGPALRAAVPGRAGLISPWMVLPPLVAIVVILVVSLFSLARVET